MLSIGLQITPFLTYTWTSQISSPKEEIGCMMYSKKKNPRSWEFCSPICLFVHPFGQSSIASSLGSLTFVSD